MKDISGESLSSNRVTYGAPSSNGWKIRHYASNRACSSFHWKEVFLLKKMALEFADIHTPLRKNTSISDTPRARGLERATYTLATSEDIDIRDFLAKYGVSTYVPEFNYRRMTVKGAPDIRKPIEPFEGSETLLGSQRLIDSPTSAEVHVIGGVTGPYVASENDWHGMFLVTRGEEPVPTFRHLTDDEMHALHGKIGQALHFLETDHPTNTNSVGFSFSPYESRRVVTIYHPELGLIEVRHPRSPVQNLASIHAHIVSMHEDNLQILGSSSELPFDQRLTREPFLPQLVELMEELVIKPVAHEFPDVDMQAFHHIAKDEVYPKGTFLSFSQEEFNRKRPAQMVRAIHARYEEVYWQIADAIVDARYIRQGRVIMRPLDEARQRISRLLELPEFAQLSLNTKRFLRMFAELEDPNKMIDPYMHPAERAKIMEQFVLLGPAYNMLYYKKDNRMVIGWHPRWITGASPLETAGVFKHQHPVDTDEFLPVIDASKKTGRRLLASLAQ